MRNGIYLLIGLVSLFKNVYRGPAPKTFIVPLQLGRVFIKIGCSIPIVVCDISMLLARLM